MRDNRTGALNDRGGIALPQFAEHRGGDQLIAPTRGNDPRKAGRMTRMGELNRRGRKGGKERVGSNDGDRKRSLGSV